MPITPWTLPDGAVIHLLTPAELATLPAGTVLYDTEGVRTVVGVDPIDDDAFGDLLGYGVPAPDQDAGGLDAPADDRATVRFRFTGAETDEEDGEDTDEFLDMDGLGVSTPWFTEIMDLRVQDLAAGQVHVDDAGNRIEILEVVVAAAPPRARPARPGFL